jgi:hypothetical protein
VNQAAERLLIQNGAIAAAADAGVLVLRLVKAHHRTLVSVIIPSNKHDDCRMMMMIFPRDAWLRIQAKKERLEL